MSQPDPFRYSRDLVATMTRIIDRAAEQRRLEHENDRDIAKLQAELGRNVGAAVVSKLVEAHVTCPSCEKPTPESEWRDGKCATCAGDGDGFEIQ